MLVKFRGIYDKKVVEGVLQCAHLEEAKNALINNSFQILSCKTIKKSINSLFKKRVDNAEIIRLLKHWSNLNIIGMNPQKALSMLAFHESNRTIRNYLFCAMLEMYFGLNVKESLEISGRHNGVELPEFCLEMLDIAEISGNLKGVILDLLEYYEVRTEFKNKVKVGTLYPKILLVIGLILVVVMLTFILPSYENLFSTIEVDIPIFTKLLFIASDLFKRYFNYIIVGFMVILTTFLLFKNKLSHLKIFDRLKCKNDLYRNIVIMNISSTLNVLLSSNVPLSQALLFSKKVTDNYYYKNALQEVIDSVNGGDDLSVSIKRSKTFGKEFCELVSIGEVSGMLKNTFKDITNYYNEVVKEKLKKIMVLIEPIAIIVVSLIMITIIMFLFIPLTNIANSQILQ